MRIIRGRYQRRHIIAPNNLPVRPTTDMAKESLFNIIENYYDFEHLSVLDLFAGTGNISYEFVSRGSQKVVAVDQDAKCVRFIRETANKLKMDELVVINSDVFRFLGSQKSAYDIVFADPPYDCQEYDALIRMVFEHHLLKENGIFILEHDKHLHFDDHEHFMEQRRYGKVNFTFFAQNLESEE